MDIRRARATLALTLACALLLSVLIISPDGNAAEPHSSTTASSLLADLTVRAETEAGSYERSSFPHWIDADGDGCNTRNEVLKAESVTPVTFSSGCNVATGIWVSWFDDTTWSDPSDVDIDHLIPLKEAWVSGAHGWTSAQLQAFANDLDFDPSLAAVTDNVNQSKGDRDPAEWIPPHHGSRCRYASEWIQVKHRWRLAVDTAELSALDSILQSCPAEQVATPPFATEILPAVGPFADVGADHPFRGEIEWIAAAGVSTGYRDGRFLPGAPVSRQAMAAFLYRYTKGDVAPPPCPRVWFSDVPRNSEFCGYIWWLASTGITGGYANGTFRPTAPVSRQAMAAFLMRYQNMSSPCDRGRFTDMGTSTFCSQVTWLSSSGITGGYPDGRFRPAAAVSRQAMAAFLARMDTIFGPTDPPLTVNPPVTTTTTRPRPTTTTTTTVPKPPNPGDTKNCSDFATWAAANAWYKKYFPWYGDVARLDGDKNGIPCESLPGAP